MLCFDPGSALFVSVLPSTNLIFSSLFMGQRKLIRVDSARETRRVCRVEGGLLRLCVCVCLCVRHSVSCMHGVSSKMQWRKIWCGCRRLPIEPVYHCVEKTVTANIPASAGGGCHDTVAHRCSGTLAERNRSCFGSVLWGFSASCTLRCLRIIQNNAI